MSMSSFVEAPNPQHRQRLVGHRACDTCRRRKVKCDEDAIWGVRCNRCTASSLNCTWDDEVKRRGRKRHVDALEARLQALEELLAQTTKIPKSTTSTDTTPDAVSLITTSPPSGTVESDEEDDPEIEPLIDRVSRLEIGAMDTGIFAISTSTGRHLTRAVNKLRPDAGPDTSIWEPDPWEAEESMKWKNTRHQFTFPPADLIPILIEAYRKNVNTHAPIIHIPSFRDSFARQRHRSDKNFAMVLLLVCAIGSRTVNDPRVVLPGQPRRSAGWMWYTQCEISRPDLLSPPTLSKIQAYILAPVYLGAVFNGRVSWMMPTLALRSMQETGVHRKRVYSAEPNAEEEQWKRCFWIAASIDVSVASDLGRPCLLVDGFFDLDLPIDCDEEYWNPSDSQQAFRQPPGRPSKAAAFIHHCKIKAIHIKAMRILFSIKAESDPPQEALLELQSDLNEWSNTTPAHLNWSTLQHGAGTSEDDFYTMAARLRLEYNYLLLIIHRPFISLRNPTPESANSLATCTFAARSTCSILRAIADKQATFVTFNVMLSANSTCLVLLFALSRARALDMQVDTEGISKDIRTCLDVLKARAPYVRHAETMHQRLSRLVYRGNVAIPAHHPMSANQPDILPPPSATAPAFKAPENAPLFPFAQFDLSANIFNTNFPSNNPDIMQWIETNIPDSAFLFNDGLYGYGSGQLQGQPDQAGMQFDSNLNFGGSAFGNTLLEGWSQEGDFMDPGFEPGGTFSDQ